MSNENEMKEKRIPLKICRLIGEGTNYYYARNFDKALEILQQVIESYPNIYEPYNIMGLIYDEVLFYCKFIKYFV
jgi:tetratricopeptide (TPR) repeat protein